MEARVASSDDAEALAAFECSTGEWFEDEVEEFIRRRALAQVMRTNESLPSGASLGLVARLLLFEHEERLVGVAGHHPELLGVEEGRFISAMRLSVLAVDSSHRGRMTEHGMRLSDIAMSTLIRDALSARRGAAVLTAIVVIDNLRSVALCERHGLRSQVAFGSRYVRLTGRFASPTG